MILCKRYTLQSASYADGGCSLSHVLYSMIAVSQKRDEFVENEFRDFWCMRLGSRNRIISLCLKLELSHREPGREPSGRAFRCR